jgi:hypothetical protein
VEAVGGLNTVISTTMCGNICFVCINTATTCTFSFQKSPLIPDYVITCVIPNSNPHIPPCPLHAPSTPFSLLKIPSYKSQLRPWPTLPLGRHLRQLLNILLHRLLLRHLTELLPGIPLVLLNDFELAGGFGFVLAFVDLFEEGVEHELGLVV